MCLVANWQLEDPRFLFFQWMLTACLLFFLLYSLHYILNAQSIVHAVLQSWNFEHYSQLHLLIHQCQCKLFKTSLFITKKYLVCYRNIFPLVFFFPSSIKLGYLHLKTGYKKIIMTDLYSNYFQYYVFLSQTKPCFLVF